MRRELACIAVAIVSLPLMAQAPVDYDNVLVPGGSGETSIAAILKRPKGTSGPQPGRRRVARLRRPHHADGHHSETRNGLGRTLERGWLCCAVS